MRPFAFLVAIAATLAPGAAPAADPPVPTPVPTIAWGACPQDQAGGSRFDCATAQVPVDYDDPTAGSFSLALIRAPASDQAARIGTLFWNPGGPGDAGTAYLPAAIDGFPAEVRARFDIVSWDPRGMGGRTTPVIQCFGSAADETAFLESRLSVDLPQSAEELAAAGAARVELAAACAGRAGALLPHVSTADNARDLDLLRQAVGEDRLTYYGTSYGTFLGATYLNMFPDRVRAAVLDGAVAPSAWAGNAGEDLTLSTFIRAGSDFASASTLRAFLDACGALSPAACAFSAGSPEATRARWAELLDRGKAGIAFQGDSISDRAILNYVGASIYITQPIPGFDRFPGWPAVAEFLQAVWEAGEGAPPPAAAPEAPPSPSASAAGASAPYLTSVGRQLAVICGESPNPGTVAAMSAQVLRSYARAGLSAWPFIASCAGWEARAANPYLGPWNTPTPIPVLVIGNTFDPATAFGSSVRMGQELGDARLLVVHGYGHTVLMNPSTCAQDHIAAYLIEGTLPPTGAACTQNTPPFPGG